MTEFKTIKQGIHNDREWKILQVIKHPLKQLENDFFLSMG